MNEINEVSLLRALSSMFGLSVTNATYETGILQGGTLGDVCRITGEAMTGSGHYPYDMVVKAQRQWERHGDPDCWRREHGIYGSNMVVELPDQIKLPRCFLLEEEEGLTRIWMAYVEGSTGNDLHVCELALAAERLGGFQADFHLRGQRNYPWLRGYPAIRSSFDLWHSRTSNSLNGERMDGFPDELRHILSCYAKRSEELLNSFNALPLTLCQGDVHHGNLILVEKGGDTDVYLIDWDCAGYGHMGEDAVDVLMEAFVYTNRDVSLLPDYRRRIIDAYCKGVRSRGVDIEMNDGLVRGIFALAWGFRIFNLFLSYQDELPKRRCVEVLSSMLMVG